MLWTAADPIQRRLKTRTERSIEASYPPWPNSLNITTNLLYILVIWNYRRRARGPPIQVAVTALQEDLLEMRKVTDDRQRWKLMGIGALAVIGIGAMAMGFTT
ncbi:DUF1515 family protein [Rhizobium mongolense]|uniref:DUF1515 family protein n=1 Tax=Rhizobium mongolense TaxID=57676 RepID=UPI000B1CD898|nr:DUF1515 family protein [Rhizobium mongolense]